MGTNLTGASGRGSRNWAGSLLVGASVVAATTLVARVVGVGRWFAFSTSVGTTCTGQVYVTANQVPNLLFEVAAGGALAAVAVPLVAAHLNRGRRVEADRAASALLTWAVAIGLPLSILVALSARPLMSFLLSSHGCQDGLEAGTLMLLIFAPQVVLYALGIVLAGVLQAHRRFFAAALAPLLSSVVVILTYLAYGWWVPADTPLGSTPTSALVLLAAGTTAGVVALSVPLLLPARQVGIRWRATFRFPAGTGRRAGALATAGVIGVGAQQLALLATVWLSNRADGVGVLTVFSYTQAIYLLPYAVLVVPLATVAFPRFVDPDQASRVLNRTAQAVAVVGVAASGVLLMTRHDVGALFLAVDAGAAGQGRSTVELIPTSLAAFAPGLVGFSMMALLTRALYAQGSARGAATAVAGGWLVSGVGPLIWWVTQPAVVPARATLLVLGIASSLGMSVAALTLAWLVRRSWGTQVLAGLTKPMAAAAAAVIPLVLAREALAMTVTVTGVIPAVLAGACGAVLVLVVVMLALRWSAPDVFTQVRGSLGRRRVTRTDTGAAEGRADSDSQTDR